MNYIRKFLILEFQYKVLLIETLILLGISRVAVLMVKFKKIAPFLGQHRKESVTVIKALELLEVEKVSWAVSLMSEHTLWESKCLVQAMTAKIMLKRRKIKSTIYLGVAKDEKQKMIAHAWIRSGDRIVTGGKGREKFTIVGIFGDE